MTEGPRLSQPRPAAPTSSPPPAAASAAPGRCPLPPPPSQRRRRADHALSRALRHALRPRPPRARPRARRGRPAAAPPALPSTSPASTDPPAHQALLGLSNTFQYASSRRHSAPPPPPAACASWPVPGPSRARSTDGTPMHPARRRQQPRCLPSAPRPFRLAVGERGPSQALVRVVRLARMQSILAARGCIGGGNAQCALS